MFLKSTISNISTLCFFALLGWVAFYPQDWLWIIYVFLWDKVVITTISKEISIHRYFCHRSFNTGKLRHNFLLFTTIFSPNDLVSVARIHRAHHVTADTDIDPQKPSRKYKDILKHTFFSGGLVKRFLLLAQPFPLPKDLLKNNNQYFFYKHHDKLFAAFCLLLLLVSWKFVVFVLLAGRRLHQINNVVCGLILTHKKMPGGYRNFETEDQSYNTPWLGYFHPGEAYHNNHHYKPNAWNFAMKPKEFDAVGWLVGKVFVRC